LVYPILLWLGFLEKKNMTYHSIFQMFILTFLVNTIFLSCGNLTRLKIPEEYVFKEDEIWPTIYHSNFRHNSISTDVEPPMEVIWHKGYKSVIADQPLAIGNYLIFTLLNGNLAYFDLDAEKLIGDGRIAPGFKHAPTIDDNILYYASNLGKETLVALNLTDFKKIWEANLPHLYTSPLVWKDRIYSGSNRGQLFCMNKRTGEKIWHFNAKASLIGIPAEENGSLYFCDIKGNIYSVDAVSGFHHWITELQPNIYGGPIIADDKLFIGTTSGIFYAVEKTSGKILWQTETGGSIYSNAAYKEGTIYFGNNDNSFFSLDARTGDINWKFKTNGIINTAPIVGENYVYFGCWDKNLYILSRITGEEISRIQFKGPIKSSPLIYKNRLYVNISNEGIYCIGTIIKETG
jgi:outer membrane protein assembly factor BamB